MHLFKRRHPSVGVGLPRPTGWGTQPLRIQPSRFPLYPCNPLICVIGDSDKWHMSPLWGFKIFVYRVCYKHVAPLGLKPMHQNSTASIVGAGLPRPTGWGTQPLRIQPSRFPLYPCNPLICESVIQTKRTCRPSGALRYLCIACAINMSPRWG